MKQQWEEELIIKVKYNQHLICILQHGHKNQQKKLKNVLKVVQNIQYIYKAQQAFLIYKQRVHTDKWNIDPEFILNEWMQSKQSAQQLLQSMLFQIGCGRSMNSNLGEYVEYIVCYFDYPNQLEPYRPSSSLNVANSCRLGRSSSYIALCASPYQKVQGIMQIRQRHRESQSK
ncbi:unnamed protein product [Paramecium pentaurelia]|uniref:SCP domain-containing protein n=1 Tax=Paramecium pentaurelia TaxID=43138 RepID=A0A8S1TPU5_9CILI|nr:unnamed protein product [Paramecium pentaurelia]